MLPSVVTGGGCRAPLPKCTVPAPCHKRVAPSAAESNDAPAGARRQDAFLAHAAFSLRTPSVGSTRGTYDSSDYSLTGDAADSRRREMQPTAVKAAASRRRQHGTRHMRGHVLQAVRRVGGASGQQQATSSSVFGEPKVIRRLLTVRGGCAPSLMLFKGQLYFHLKRLRSKLKLQLKMKQ